MKYYLKNLITGKTMFRFPNKEFLENWLISLSTYEHFNCAKLKSVKSNVSTGNFFLENLCTISIKEYRTNKKIADRKLKNRDCDFYINPDVFVYGINAEKFSCHAGSVLFDLIFCDYIRYLWSDLAYPIYLKKSCIIIDEHKNVYDFSELLYKSQNGAYTKEYINSRFEGVSLTYARYLLSNQSKKRRYKYGNRCCCWGKYDGRIPIKYYIPFDVIGDDCDYQSNNCLKVNNHNIRFRKDEYYKGSKPNWKDSKKRKAWMRKGDITKQNKFKQDLWDYYYDEEYPNLI